jgi:hypothetical protein
LYEIFLISIPLKIKINPRKNKNKSQAKYYYSKKFQKRVKWSEIDKNHIFILVVIYDEKIYIYKI